MLTNDRLSTQTEWNVIFATLRSTISNPKAARSTFDLVASFASEGQGYKITPDNFAGLLSTLDDFATAAGASIRLAWPDMLMDLGKMGMGSAEVIKNLKDSDDGRFELKTISSPPTKNVVRAYGWCIAEDCCVIRFLKVKSGRCTTNSAYMCCIVLQ